MAIDPKDLTIDYRKIQSMPFRDRKALLYSSYADQVNAALTPSQRANLFPNYYAKDAAAGATSGGTAAAGGNPNLSKADYLKRARQGGVSNSDYNRVSGTPEEKGPPKITASEFHAVESNPFLAGYADKTQRGGPSGAGARVAGTGELKGRQNTMKSVYDAYVSAGFSHKQALAFTAEVGRENNYNPDLMFGTHTDLNGQTNIGMVSMQKDRRTALKDFLGKKGLLDADGRMIQSQETLNAQAQFQMQEIKEKYPRTAKEFLANPDISMEDAAVVLGDDYIRWARKGNTKIGFSAADAARHAAGRDANYAEIQKITEDFKPIAEQTTPTDAMAVVQQVAGETPMASELKGTATEVAPVDGGKIKPVADPVAFMQGRNARAKAEIDDVDPVLLKSYSEGIQQFEADNPQYAVEVFGHSGGVRHSGSTRNHGEQHDTGHGGALDLVIIDRKTGKQLTNFNKPYPGQQGSPGETAPLYAKLHSAAALAQSYYFPDSQQITFGGGFTSGDTHFDLMHGDVTHKSGSLGYSWEEGWTPSMLKNYKIPENVAIGSKDEQAALAQKIYGKVDSEGNYANRLVAVKNEQENSINFASAEVKAAAVAAAEVKPADSATVTPEASTTTVASATTPSATAAATPPPPESDTHPTKTMAQGGIIPKSADTQIVQKNMSGDIVSATKVGENENEKMSIEPVSKMNADSLTKSSSNPVEANMIESKSQSAPEEKKVSMQRQSTAAPRLSSDPYSNIQGDIKPMSPTARAAMMAARDLSTQRRGYSL